MVLLSLWVMVLGVNHRGFCLAESVNSVSDLGSVNFRRIKDSDNSSTGDFF